MLSLESNRGNEDKCKITFVTPGDFDVALTLAEKEGILFQTFGEENKREAVISCGDLKFFRSSGSITFVFAVQPCQ